MGIINKSVIIQRAVSLEGKINEILALLKELFISCGVSKYCLFYRGTHGLENLICCNGKKPLIKEYFDDGRIEVVCDTCQGADILRFPSSLGLKYQANNEIIPTYIAGCCSGFSDQIKNELGKNKELKYALDHYDKSYSDSIWHKIYQDLRITANKSFFLDKSESNVFHDIVKSFSHLGLKYGVILIYIPPKSDLILKDSAIGDYLVKQKDYISTTIDVEESTLSEEALLSLSSEEDKLYSVSQFCNNIMEKSFGSDENVLEFGWLESFNFKNASLNKFNKNTCVLFFPVWDKLNNPLHRRLSGIGVLFFDNIISSENLINARRFEIASENIELSINHSQLLYTDKCEQDLQRIIVAEQLDSRRVKLRLEKLSAELLNCEKVELCFIDESKQFYKVTSKGNERIALNSNQILYQMKKDNVMQLNHFNHGDNASQLYRCIVGINNIPVGIAIFKNKLSDYRKHVIPFSSEDQKIAQNICYTIGWIVEVTDIQDKQIEFFKIAKHEITNAENVVNISCIELEEKVDSDRGLQLIQDIRHNTLIATRFLINADIRGLYIQPDKSKNVFLFGDVIIKWLRSYKMKAFSRRMDFIIPTEEEYKRIVPSIKVKLDHIDLLFFNLIGNAFKYGARFSNVIVDIKKEEENIIVDIINYGNAWKEEETPYLFNKDVRGSNSTSLEEGSGLGLFIVDTIAKAYNIDVKVISPKKLSDFNLPIAGYLLSKAEPSIIGLTGNEAQNIRSQIESLSLGDKRMFIRLDDSKDKKNDLKIGRFSVIAVKEHPTYEIIFRVIIPNELLMR